MIHNCIINSKWLKEFSPYPLNYDTKELDNYIKLSETIWLLPILGYDWYEELLQQVKDNTLTEANSTALIEAIYPYLGFAIAYEALPLTWASVTEIGIGKGHSDNFDSLTLKDMTYISQHLRSQLEARKDYCKKWICEHLDSFPLALPCNCDCECCNQKDKLNPPNPNYELYSPNRKCTDLK